MTPGRSSVGAEHRGPSARDLAEQAPIFVIVTVCGLAFTLFHTIVNELAGARVLATWVVGAAYLLNLAHYALRRETFSFALATSLISLFGCLAIQYFFGGVLASGVNAIWSIGAALTFAVLLRGRPLAWALLVFGVSVAAELFAEFRWPPPPLVRPAWVPTVMAIGNVVVLGLLSTIALNVFIRQRDGARAALAAENERSDELLARILPRQIVSRLKERVGTLAERLEATILFADIVGFTSMARKDSPEKVVQLLDQLFSRFDEVVERYGLEKIKTIGDAYMVAGGVPEPRADHVEAVARLALELRDVVKRFREERAVDLRVRIGVHTGPVVAGVIGRKRFTYDLWGDTVNLASRMESHGEPDVIQVTEAVYDALRERFELEPRGQVSIKGVGDMRTWRLAALRRAE